MRGRLARQWQSQNSRSRETGGGGRRQEQLGGKRPQRGSGARTGHHGKDTAGSGEPEGDPQTPGRKRSGSFVKVEEERGMGAGHPRAGTELAPRIGSAWRAKGSGGRGPGRGAGVAAGDQAPRERARRAATRSPAAGTGTRARLGGGGAARSPARRTGRCRPGCGRGLGRPWPPPGTGPPGRSRSGSVIPLPPSPLLPHRGILGAGSTAPPPENGEGEGRREDRPTD